MAPHQLSRESACSSHHDLDLSAVIAAIRLNKVLSVDEMWLAKETSRPASRVEATPRLNRDAEPRSEREIIETALAATRGRVSGSSGAAAKLGIPPSTLETRIKALKINKSQFKFR